MNEAAREKARALRECFATLDIRIAIDNLNLVITARGTTAEYMRAYAVGTLKPDVLAAIHDIEGT